MGLNELQGALARLYTDGTLRERFFTQPHVVRRELELTGEEADQLAAIEASIVGFARSLQVKRLMECRRMMPATCATLGADYRRLFLEYATTPPPGGRQKVARDALLFLRFVAAWKNPGAPPWLSDLARYEAAWIEAGFPETRLRVRLFQWPVDLLDHGSQPGPLHRRPFVGIWLRASHRDRLIYQRLQLL